MAGLDNRWAIFRHCWSTIATDNAQRNGWDLFLAGRVNQPLSWLPLTTNFDKECLVVSLGLPLAQLSSPAWRCLTWETKLSVGEPCQAGLESAAWELKRLPCYSAKQASLALGIRIGTHVNSGAKKQEQGEKRESLLRYCALSRLGGNLVLEEMKILAGLSLSPSLSLTHTHVLSLSLSRFQTGHSQFWVLTQQDEMVAAFFLSSCEEVSFQLFKAGCLTFDEWNLEWGGKSLGSGSQPWAYKSGSP